MIHKISKLIVVMVMVCMPLLTMQPVSAVVDTCTWSGAVNANWNDVGNWNCSVDGAAIPENGDALIFPEAASNKSTINDIGPLSLTGVQISGSGYTLAGMGLTLTGTTPMIVNQSATIDLNITYAPSFNAFLRVATTQTLTVNGTTTFSGVTGEVNVGGGGFQGTIDFVGNVNGDAGTQFIAVSNARAILWGASNTFNANTVGAESNATFECRSTTCFGDAGNSIYMGGGTVAIYQTGTYTNDWETSVTTPDTSWLAAHSNVTMSGNGTVNDAIGISQDVAGSNLQLTGSITNNSGMSLFSVDTSAQVRIDGAVSGAGGFSIGDGSFRLGGPSTYDGTNTINSGAIVTLTHQNGLGSNTGITHVLAGGSLQFNVSSPQTIDEELLLNGTGVSDSGVLVNDGETVSLPNTVTLNGDSLVKVNNNFLNFDGIISGSANLTIDSLDTNNYASLGATNTYTGTTTIYGAIGLDAVGAVPGDLILVGDAFAYPSASNVVVGSLTMTSVGADRPHWDQVGPYTNTFTALSGNGTMLLDGATSTLTLDQDSDTTYAGNFSGNDGPITKTGTGTFTHTGNCSASSKLVTVQQGTLVLNTASNTCQYAVLAGATLKGSGTAGTLTFSNGSMYSPGNSPGCMAANTLNLNNGATFLVEMAGTTACSGYDQTTVSGAANISGANLSLSPSFTPADGTVFTILTAGSITGTFNGLVNGATVTVSGMQFQVAYTATAVTLTKLSGTNTAVPSSLSNTGQGGVVSVIAGVGLLLVVAWIGRNRTELAAEI